MRFVPPTRTELAVGCFQQPIFADLAGFRDLLEGSVWPGLDQLDRVVQPLHHRTTGRALRLSAQELLVDDENYELRIFERGVIATRLENWHDLLNALVWKCFPAIKSALNAGQVGDMRRLGLRERSRRQCALTQFDEAGAVAIVRDRALLAAWDRHDWRGLFLGHRDAWSDGRIQSWIFGHALFEHALDPHMLLVSKTLVILDEDGLVDSADIDQRVADAIADGACLGDPQDLRPLPLAGIPGWHRDRQDADFYLQQPCFRPLRAGRRYPEPLRSRRMESA